MKPSSIPPTYLPREEQEAKHEQREDYNEKTTRHFNLRGSMSILPPVPRERGRRGDWLVPPGIGLWWILRWQLPYTH
jgi:hypothetical protein